MLRNRSLAVLVRMHGGASYTEEEHARAYDSLAHAKRIWERRRDFPHWLTEHGGRYPGWGDPSIETAIGDGTRYHAAFAYIVDRDWLPDLTGPPCPDTGQPTYTVEGMHPDYELTVGPRGGLRWERC